MLLGDGVIYSADFGRLESLVRDELIFSAGETLSLETNEVKPSPSIK